jgi:hypothetical protein
MALSKMHRVATVVAGLIAAATTFPLDAAPSYTATRLGTLGGNGGSGNGINAAG